MGSWNPCESQRFQFENWIKIGVLFLGMLPLPPTLTTRIITIHTVRIPVNLYFPIRLGREHTNLYSFTQTTAQMDVFPRYFPSSYGGPLPSDVLKCEGPSVTPKRGVRHRSLAIYLHGNLCRSQR